MIHSFRCSDTGALFRSKVVRRFANIERVARRKLLQELNMAVMLDEIHPGEILLEDFMKPMGISARQLAADIDVSPSRISELVHGHRPINADTALRLGLFLTMDPRFWLNLQTQDDMRVASRTIQAKIAPRIRVFQAQAAA